MSATTYETTGGLHEDSLLRTSSHAIADATADARASARVAAQNVKDGVGWGVYKAAFGVSFGVVFSAVFVTELLPGSSSLRRGLEDGATAALDAIEERKLLHDDDAAGLGAVDDEHVPVPPKPAARPRPRPAAATAPRPPRKRTPAAEV